MMRARMRALLTIFAMLLLGSPCFAQEQLPPPPPPSITGATSASGVTDDASLRDGGTSLIDDQRNNKRALPFGHELFKTQRLVDATEGNAPDRNYILRPGDTVQISQWGLVTTNQQVKVDASGNILVPGVGPVRVAGRRAGEVNAIVSAAARKIYRETVDTYATPVTSNSIQVFVTGPVKNPGLHTGNTRESMVGFLQRAGGPDDDRGSYRNIVLKRNGRIIARLDLYQFLYNGEMPGLSLQDGDVIVVGQQGTIVTVSGDARAPFTFEFSGDNTSGFEILRFARPRPEVTVVTLFGVRNSTPFNQVVSLNDFGNQLLLDGDRVHFQASGRAETIVVRVEGAFDGAGSYVVPRGTKVGDVLGLVKLDAQANRPMIHLRRVSAARTQKAMLDESLSRLERLIYTENSVSPSRNRQVQQEAAGLERYVARARQARPEGLVSLQGADPSTVVLEPNDVIVIPFVSQTVIVGGEVAFPQSLILGSSADVRTIIGRAGGFTKRANKKEVLVIHPDGSTTMNGRVSGGDRVLVLPKLSSGLLSVVGDLTQVIFQAGIGAAAVLP